MNTFSIDRIRAGGLTASPNVGPRFHRRIGRPNRIARLASGHDAARAWRDCVVIDRSGGNDGRNRLGVIRYPSRDPAAVGDHGPSMRLLEHAATSLADEGGAIGRRGRRGQHLVVLQQAIIAAMGARNVETTSIGSVIKIAESRIRRPCRALTEPILSRDRRRPFAAPEPGLTVNLDRRRRAGIR